MNSHVMTGLSDIESIPTGDGYRPRTLVLLGSGQAHLHVLHSLATKPLVGVQVILVAPHPRHIFPSMVPDLLAGLVEPDRCAITLEPLVQRAGVRWQQCSAKGLDAVSQTLTLDDGSVLHYDWLCINIGAVLDRERIEHDMPGARTHALFVRPTEGFLALWPRVVALCAERPLSVAVVGSGPDAVSLACALRKCLPTAALTLICRSQPRSTQAARALQGPIAQALRQRRITVLHDEAKGFESGLVRLHSGATLACDVPLLAFARQAPPWLANSGIAVDTRGFIQTDDSLRSCSHGQIFASGSVRAQPDELLWGVSGGGSEFAATTLADNLAASIAQRPLAPLRRKPSSFRLLSFGDGSALAQWGPVTAQGRWVGWLQRWRDQRRLVAYRTGYLSPGQ